MHGLIYCPSADCVTTMLSPQSNWCDSFYRPRHDAITFVIPGKLQHLSIQLACLTNNRHIGSLCFKYVCSAFRFDISSLMSKAGQAADVNIHNMVSE